MRAGFYTSLYYNSFFCCCCFYLSTCHYLRHPTSDYAHTWSQCLWTHTFDKTSLGSEVTLGSQWLKRSFSPKMLFIIKITWCGHGAGSFTQSNAPALLPVIIGIEIALSCLWKNISDKHIPFCKVFTKMYRLVEHHLITAQWCFPVWNTCYRLKLLFDIQKGIQLNVTRYTVTSLATQRNAKSITLDVKADSFWLRETLANFG